MLITCWTLCCCFGLIAWLIVAIACWFGLGECGLGFVGLCCGLWFLDFV